MKEGQNRLKVTLTLPEDLIKWVDKQVALREFATRSHAVEVALIELRRDQRESSTHKEGE